MNESDVRKIKWGDVYYCDLGEGKGSVQSKLRPVMIVQNNIGNENGPTTVVAAISSVMKKMYLPTHIQLDPNCGLREKSIVMLEQIRTIDTKDLMEYVGTVRDAATIEAIKRGIAIELGVIECPKPSRPGGKFCVSVFRQNQEYHVINVHDGAYSPWLQLSRKVGAVCAPCTA